MRETFQLAPTQKGDESCLAALPPSRVGVANFSIPQLGTCPEAIH
jgi:hypothetical protein